METLRLLDLDIDRSAQRVCRGGELLPVHGLSWRLLECLLAHGDAVVGFDTLATEVWAPAVVGEDAISQRVKLLRQALGDDGRRPRYVRSVRGRGYQLCVAPAAASAGPACTPRRVRFPAGLRGVGLGLGGVLGLAAIVTISMAMLSPVPPAPAPASPLVQRADYYAGIGQAGNTARAVDLYRQALQVDPDHVPALLGLSRSLSAQVCLYNMDPSRAQEALQLAVRGQQLAQGDAPPWAALGYAHDCLGNMPAAIEGYERALQADPRDERTRASLAYLRQERGQLVLALADNIRLAAPERVRFRDVQVARELELLGFTAVAQQRHARQFQLYPDNVFANIAWPRSLFLAGDPVRAEQVLQESLARGTPHPDLYRLQGELALLRGDAHAAQVAFARALHLRPHRSLLQTLAGLHGPQAIDPAWVDARLRTLASMKDDGWNDAHIERALLLQARHDAPAALDALHDAVTSGFRDSAWLQVSPLVAPLRRAPGWPALIERIEADLRLQRTQVLAADWRPPELVALTAGRAAGTR